MADGVDLVDGHGLALVAEEAGTGGGDEIVLLVAEAAEVAPAVDGIVAEELGEAALGTPAVDELGDEVDAGLDGEDETRLEGTRQTERLETEEGALRLAVVADPLFTEVLHIVDVEAHHVARAAGEEEGMGSGRDGLVHIALHEAETLHAFGYGGAGGEVDIAEGHAGSQRGHSRAVGVEAEVEDGLLTLVELLAYRARGGEVAAVVAGHLGTGVEEEEVAVVGGVNVAMVVERLAVCSGDDGERVVAPTLLGNGGDGCAHLGLVDAGAHHAHHGAVHIHGDVDSLLYLFNLLGCLVVAHIDDGTDESLPPLTHIVGGDRTGRKKPERLQFEDVLGAVGGQEMDGAARGQGSLDHLLETGEGKGLRGSDHGGLLAEEGLRAHPDDVVDGEVVAEDNVASFIDVDDGSEAVEVESEVVEERGVLTETVGVVGIIHRSMVVAEEQQHAAAHAALQLRPPLDIGFFAKHGFYFYKS